MRRRAGLVVSAVTVAVITSGAPVSAVDDSTGTPGFCPDADGVTVVVDFQQLGGETIVRCAPGDEARSGWEALQGAGFAVEGTQRWGEGFVCRVEGRPAATEPLPMTGDEDYRESCVDTPPTGAYWSYWQAEDGGSWTYSNVGVQSQQAVAGGFEGWSFSLDRTEGSAPPPAIAPQRPAQPEDPAGEETVGGTGGTAGAGGPEPGGSGTGGSGTGSSGTGSSGTGSSGTGGSGSGGPGSGGPGTGGSGTGGSGPTGTGGTDDGAGVGAPVPGPLPRDRADGGGGGLSTRTEATPAEPTWTGGEGQPDASAAADSGSPTSALAGLGVAALLAAAAGVLAWRRRERS